MKRATTVLAFCTAALLSLGLVVLFGFSLDFRLGAAAGMQLAYGGVGLALAALVAWIDYRHYPRVSWILLGISLLLLVAVLLVGVTRNGATRWLQLGPLTAQPSESAKLVLVLWLAHYAQRHQHRMREFVRGLLIPGAVAGVFLALIFLEPDWGSTLLLAAVTGVMLLVAGVRWGHLLPPVLMGAAALGLLLVQNPTRLQRVESWWNPEQTKEGVGYQAFQAKLALGSGGLTGVGLGNGGHYGYVPEYETDFIFAALGEELGLICTLAVLAAFVTFVLCGIYIAWNAGDTFGCLLATGLTFLIGLQAFINMGVVTSLLPNKGLPLPFVSRGGSSLAVMLVCVGVLFSIARHSRPARRSPVAESELEELPSVGNC